jgi:hypothetical protein
MASTSGRVEIENFNGEKFLVVETQNGRPIDG